MRRPYRVMQWVGAACLAGAGLLAFGLAWPSPRTRIDLSLPGEQAQSGWVSLRTPAVVMDVAPVPDLSVAIDLPQAALKGRRERLELEVRFPSEGVDLPAYTLAAEIVSVDAVLTPPGESGQALRPGTAFEWTLVALRAPEVSVTILARLRRHAPGGEAEAERLLLARDVVLPVRSIAGLSAPAATWAAGAMALVGAILSIAAAVSRTH